MDHIQIPYALFQREQRRCRSPRMIALRDKHTLRASDQSTELTMTRSIIAIASALFAAIAMFGSAAQACISCEYTPPVVNTPVYSHGAYHHGKKRAHRAAKIRRARKAKKHIVKTRRAPAKVEAAEVAPETKPAKAAKAAVNQNSSISIAKTDVAPADDAPETTGSTDTETASEAKVDCKKFFPSVGMTLTVPCN
jgi:hypothetical protein